MAVLLVTNEMVLCPLSLEKDFFGGFVVSPAERHDNGAFFLGGSVNSITWPWYTTWYQARMYKCTLTEVTGAPHNRVKKPPRRAAEGRLGAQSAMLQPQAA